MRAWAMGLDRFGPVVLYGVHKKIRHPDLDGQPGE